MNEQENGIEVPGVVDNLAAKVKEASLDPDCNAMCEEMITSWAQKGLVGESCPKMLMMTPCGTKGHTPVPPEPGAPGMGYFLLAGDKLSAGLVELIKSDPAAALKGERGCGYKGCHSTYWDSLEAYNHLYPRELMCQSREVLHPVIWADPDDDGCKEHPESSVWSHPNITCRMLLKYLEKSVMSKFRSRPTIFNVTKNGKLGKTSKYLLETENWIVLTYRQLLVWTRVRDFGVDLELVG